MKLSYLKSVLPVFIFSSPLLMAEEYQSISSFDFKKLEYKHFDNKAYLLKSTYFFDKKSTLGPLDQFEYINKTSNVSGGYFDTDHTKTYVMGGEHFINKFLIGASYHYSDFDFHAYDNKTNEYGLKIGYLISDNLIVKANAKKVEIETDFSDDILLDSKSSENYYNFSISYNHHINESDYIGVTYNTDEDLDTQTISSKYFMAIDQSSYLTAGISYTKNVKFGSSLRNDDNDWAANLGYYFNDRTSAFVSYDDNDDYVIGAKHYFNNNYSVSVNYSANASSNELKDNLDIYGVNFTAQF